MGTTAMLLSSPSGTGRTKMPRDFSRGENKELKMSYANLWL